MKSNWIAGLLAACGLFVGGQTLIAHHAGTMFDDNKTVELNGTIKEFQFTNPHSWIQVVADNKEWSIEWGSPNQLARQGILPSTFKSGAKVVMRVHPMRDGSAAGNFVAAKFDDGKTVGRWE